MTLHVYTDVEQRSEEWHALRRGIVTASAVGKLVTVGPPDAGAVGCPRCQVKANVRCVSMASKQRVPIKSPHWERITKAESLPPLYAVADNDTSNGLTTTLAAERITGWTEDTPMTNDMWRGVEHEPYARDIYSGHYAEAVECGFMRRDEPMPWDPNEVARPVDEATPMWSLGLSPDGLVGADGLIEIKCPRQKTHLATILADEVPAHYMAQCQAALLVSGRKWLDFVSYVGGMPLYVKRVIPDPAWFEAITAAVIQFEINVAGIVDAYNTATANMPATERPSLEIVI